jgi:hypothetical protein
MPVEGWLVLSAPRTRSSSLVFVTGGVEHRQRPLRPNALEYLLRHLSALDEDARHALARHLRGTTGIPPSERRRDPC